MLEDDQLHNIGNVAWPRIDVLECELCFIAITEHV